MRTLVVTGTGTDVGKTVVTAAIAALARIAGRRVAVVKPAQTGVDATTTSDVDVVRRLSLVDDVHELVRYPEPLAPATAARRAGLAPLPVAAMVASIRALRGRDLVLVEGAGGLLVHLDDRGHTVADIASALGAPVVVVAAAGLGTLNATALTVEGLHRRGVTPAGVVVGAWPDVPDVAAVENLRDLGRYTGVELIGCVPAGAGTLDPDAFSTVARSALAPALGGDWGGP